MSNDTNLESAIQELKQVLPQSSWSDDIDFIMPHLKEWRDRWHGHTPLLLTPRSTKEVSQLVNICAKYTIALTTQGGNTGLVGGQIPQGEILVSTKHLNKLHEQNDFSIIVGSGYILEKLHSLLDQENKLFPLSLASQGSATVGGLCSTNAGGVHVIRYGSMRDLTLGVEVVLADGTIFNSLHTVKKDNTGYNLTPLFLGAEGTLGIITAVKLKLFSKATQQETLLIAIDNLDHALALLKHAKNAFANELSLIELIPNIALDFVNEHMPNCSIPFDNNSTWYVLLQFESSLNESLKPRIESLVESLLDKMIVKEAVLAQSIKQAHALVMLRESISEAQKPEGGSIKHDVSVPIDCIPEFIREATLAVQNMVPNCRPVPFGHLGDGNIHFNVSQPIGMNTEEYLSHWEPMNHLVHDIVTGLGGSISAEHGIGILKKQELLQRCDPVKYALMKKLKHTIDPKNIMNPRVLL